jgi:predicted ArsR family transcriptional regulator
MLRQTISLTKLGLIIGKRQEQGAVNYCGYSNGSYGGSMTSPTAPEDPGMSAQAITAVAALEDQLRRGMYEFIRAERRPVTREQAAAAVGISRKLAAFHLDKLVEAGLLRARYEAAGTLRRVGRAPKVYEPTDVDIRVSIPERRSDVLGGILIDAVLSEARDETARQAAMRVAGDHGRDVAAAERAHVRPGRLGAERALTLAEGVLQRHGYEPFRQSPSCVQLRNCPFHVLVVQSTELVCGLNHAYLTGFVGALGAPAVEAVLSPQPGACCVELRVGPTSVSG